MKLTSLPAMATVAALLAGFSAGASAQATYNASMKFDFGAPCNTPTCSVTQGPTTYTANISGFSSSGSGYVKGNITDQGSSSGVGFTGRNGPTSTTYEVTSGSNHAFDNNPSDGSNSNGWEGHSNELMLINFGSTKINLTQIQTGWSTNDTDVMVFRWTGGDMTSAQMDTWMAGTNGAGSLLSRGWDLVSAKDLDNNPSSWTTTAQETDRDFNLNTGSGYTADETDKVSSWWLVTTYFSGAGVDLGDSSKDYFKLLSFTGRVCSSTVKDGSCVENPKDPPPAETPEPASMALAGLALAGLAVQRRRRKLVAA